ncbi:hypothetical protein ACV3R4_10000 [Clostridium perfringens]|uniref:hypothetical protein n=4 Tax=Clostridium perfringens TaxID=1502 RepID=UPI001FAEBC18|nr:hypothetical protein [Clostridium perfringens]MDJ8959097.1 hypothetical protein [Clostridium perfringens]MDT7913800.1 hypothetical protein [Clostridium perfringens]MDT7926963.1 hypothetical protein [Clostridium perfringens]MDT7975692.1 hypothetical protein [Clostridium perfringens]MDT8011278.1 hypothetical protein [Clostridium perfringens]
MNNKWTILFSIFAILSSITSLFEANYMYIPFIIYLIFLILKKKKSLADLINLSVYSLLLPSNYVIIFIGVVIFFIYIIKNTFNKKEKKYYIFSIIVIIYIIINIIINQTSIKYIAFFLIYSGGFFIWYIIFRDNNLIKNSDNKYVLQTIDSFIIIEFIYTLSKVIFHLNYVIKNIDIDWSSGTLGIFQGNILMIICTCCFVRYIYEINVNFNKRYIKYAIMSILLAISTACISNLVIFILSLVIYSILFTRGFINKIKMLSIIMIIGLIFSPFATEWVRSDLEATFNLNNIDYKFKKIKTYKDTFVNIPKEDIKFLLLGAGIGNYSSRTALTLTGEYIESYNSFFVPETTRYTNDYILANWIRDKNIDGGGVRNVPWSSIISIMGEFGLVGLIMFFVFFLNLLLKVKSYKKILILFFLGICFMDNWVEYYKVTFILWSMIFIDY